MDFIGFATSTSLIAFVCASLVYLFGLQKSEAQSKLNKVAFLLVIIAVTSVTGACLSIVLDDHSVPPSALLLSACVGWLSILGHTFFRFRLMGVFTTPVCALILLMHFYFSETALLKSTDGGWLVIGHVFSAILGQSLAILASAVSLFYLWQQNALKKKILQNMNRDIPALDRLSKILEKALWLAFLFLSLSLLTGAFFTFYYSTEGDDFFVKTIWAVIVWVWYLVILIGRNAMHIAEKRVAQLSVIGFVLIAMTYFGVLLVPSAGGF